MEKSLLKDSVRQIKNTFKRFLSIVAIVLLGVGFFAGITATSPDMKDTIDKYFDDEDVMDIEVISTLGLTDEDIEALKQVDGTKEVVGTYSIDATFSNDKKEYVVKIESMPDTINNVILKEGSLPQNADECVVESSLLTMTGYKIGDYITLNPQKVESSTSIGDIDISNDEDSSDNNSSNEESDSNNDSTVKNKKVKIVGMVQSPLYHGCYNSLLFKRYVVYLKKPHTSEKRSRAFNFSARTTASMSAAHTSACPSRLTVM